MTLLTLPSTRQEAFRWTDVDGIAAAASLPRSQAGPAGAFWLDLPGDRLLFVDGELHASSRLHRAELAEVAASDPPLGSRASGRDGTTRANARTSNSTPFSATSRPAYATSGGPVSGGRGPRSGVPL